jgi:hypothetical protein
MEREGITHRISEVTIERNGKECLPCAAAFRLAEECEVGVRQIGKICQENGIKIVQCQLGCFS